MVTHGRFDLTAEGKEALREGYFEAKANEIRTHKEFQQAAIDTVEIKRKYYQVSISIAVLSILISFIALFHSC